MTPARDPQTGKFVSGGGGGGGGIWHRASAWFEHDDDDELLEPAYTFQAPDVNRHIVQTFLQCAGPEAGTLPEDGFQQVELSFDADAAFLGPVPGGGNVIADDTRSSVIAYAGVRFDETVGGIRVGGMGSGVRQSALWRRGTELFLHGELDAGATSTGRAIVWYTEQGD